MKNKEGGNFEDFFNKGAWIVADMFKSFMNDVVIPAVEGKGKKGPERVRKPRPGEIVGTFENESDKRIGRYGIYAGSDSFIAIFPETGGAGVIKKVEIDEFLESESCYFVIDMENFKEYISGNEELSDDLEAKDITLEFVNDETSLAKAGSLIGCETTESSSDDMLAMALWCRTGLADKDEVAYVKDLILANRTCVYRDREDDGETSEENDTCASDKSEN
jgi:hypothetical protein